MKRKNPYVVSIFSLIVLTSPSQEHRKRERDEALYLNEDKLKRSIKLEWSKFNNLLYFTPANQILQTILLLLNYY